jgi:uncharacterized protein (DUF736 family)
MFIGNFKPAGDNYAGVIKTLTFKTDAVFEPIEKKSEKSPDYRVTNGNTDIGVAWKKTSEAGADVKELRPDLTEKQCREVLLQAFRKHDAEIGINWDVLPCHADDLFPEGEAV